MTSFLSVEFLWYLISASCFCLCFHLIGYCPFSSLIFIFHNGDMSNDLSFSEIGLLCKEKVKEEVCSHILNSLSDITLDVSRDICLLLLLLPKSRNFFLIFRFLFLILLFSDSNLYRVLGRSPSRVPHLFLSASSSSNVFVQYIHTIQYVFARPSLSPPFIFCVRVLLVSFRLLLLI